MYITRKRTLEDTKQLRQLAEASGELWSNICASFWRTVRRQGVWLSKYSMQRWEVDGNERLHSHTAQAVGDQFFEALSGWRSKRERDPKCNPPHKQKRFNKVVWKSSAIGLVG